MKTPHALALLLGLGLIVLATSAAFTEDEKKKPLTPAEMETAAMELSTKCPAHDALKMFVGDWVVSGKGYSQVMGEYPITGEAAQKPLWDGRFIRTEFEGPGPAGSIYGTGHIGYDRLTKEYVNTWMMSMGTQISVSRGTYDAKTKTFNLSGVLTVHDGSKWMQTWTLKFESADKYVETSSMGPVGGKMLKTIDLTFTRKATKPTTK